MVKPSVALRMTPHLTSTAELRYMVERFVEDAGVLVDTWMAHPGENPGLGTRASPSLEVLFNAAELSTQAAMDSLRTIIRALSRVRHGCPELPLAAVVEIRTPLGPGTVRLAYRRVDDPDAMEGSASALQTTSLEESGALGWDAGAASWVKL